MILARRHVTLLLNALHETGKHRITVKHPCGDVGELLRVRLADPFESTVRFTQSLSEYVDTRGVIQREYGPDAHDDLPDDSAYVRSLVASGVLDISNRDEVTEFVHRHGYRDLEAGHPPVIAGIDANIMPWDMGSVLGIDHVTGGTDDADRSPTNGYALATGVKEELDWHYNQYQTASLVNAFGEEFERVDNQPAGNNREGFLGLYEFRRLMADRNVDLVDCETGDENIVEAYRAFASESRKDVVLFSNDFGFIDLASDAAVPAQHVDFPRTLPRKTTASWDDIADLVYYLTIRFGVLKLPGATLYGVWNGKDGRHWQHEELVVEPRSPKVEAALQRDQKIVDAFDN
ncbi:MULTISPECIES: hypothetical protein [Haloferax]|uniref:Uncharacterized protein n=1 Tax=Haloferax marinum TaxID=2666143 RepID=A0A6A8GC05_9EURY|nr:MULTISPECIES: hypothetical protein [Haloferax]KAB1190747.1 hypothetical protein Hfx1150_17095 [Haloferax sp. CBA1150]MRW98285.1 hypothetical protein [Haloferax marinum]